MTRGPRRRYRLHVLIGIGILLAVVLLPGLLLAFFPELLLIVLGWAYSKLPRSFAWVQEAVLVLAAVSCVAVAVLVVAEREALRIAIGETWEEAPAGTMRVLERIAWFLPLLLLWAAYILSAVGAVMGG